jgi:hypothetical protein
MTFDDVSGHSYTLPAIARNGVFFVFFNILFRFQFRDCEGNTLQLYCVPNSEKSHSYKAPESLCLLLFKNRIQIKFSSYLILFKNAIK